MASAPAPGPHPARLMPRPLLRGVPAYLTALALVAATLGLRLALGFRTGDAPMVILFVLPILAAAGLGGLGPGLAATVAAGLSTNWFLIPPVHSLAIAGWNARLTWAALWVIGVATSLVVASLQRTARRAHAQGEALRSSEERLRLFVQHTPAAVALLDAGMRYLAVSRRWLADYGLADQEVLGRSHYALFPDIPERWREVHRRCLAGAVERCEEDPFPRSDGTVDWVRWEIHPWHDAAGRVGGIVLLTEVITDRKRAEDALRQSEEQLRLALDSARMGTWNWDLARAQLTWSDRCHELLGFRPGDAVSYDAFLRAVDPRDRDRVDGAVRQALESRADYQTEMRIAAPDGTQRWVASRGHATYDGGGRAVRMTGVVLDVTEARQRAEELEQALAKVKTLSGLIPICMYCKSVRNDRGYWDRIEAYIASHTDALFSHGLCPTCFARHYPGDPGQATQAAGPSGPEAPGPVPPREPGS